MKRLKLGVLAAGAVAISVSIGCALFFGPSSEELTAIRGALATDGALVLDVRSPEEFDEEHLRGAVNVPHDEVADRLDEVGDTARPVIVYCQSGVRSGWAADTLRDASYLHVHDLGSIDNGPEVGLAIVSAPHEAR